LKKFYCENLKFLEQYIQQNSWNKEEANNFQNIMMLFAITIIGGQRLEITTHFTETVNFSID
jgi:hypothetical protein